MYNKVETDMNFVGREKKIEEFWSAMYIGIMLVVDILYGVIDPRIRVAKEGD